MKNYRLRECKVTVTDKLTGEVLFELDGAMHSITYSKSTNDYYGGFSDKIAPVSVTCKVQGFLRESTSQKAECEHSWIQYSGLLEQKFYCGKCGLSQ